MPMESCEEWGAGMQGTGGVGHGLEEAQKSLQGVGGPQPLGLAGGPETHGLSRWY